MCFSAKTAYPFVVCRRIYDPLVSTSVAAMLEECFLCWEGSRMGIPLENQFIGISINNPAAVTNNACPPVAFFLVVDGLPFVGTTCWF